MQRVIRDLGALPCTAAICFMLAGTADDSAAQIPTEAILRFHSPSSRYMVQARGPFYEGWTGAVELILQSNHDDTLWTKTADLGGWPLLSDSGIVTITDFAERPESLIAFTPEGDTLGTFKPHVQAGEQYYHDCNYCWPLLAHSPDGKVVYTLLRVMEEMVLVAFAPDMSERWRVPVPEADQLGDRKNVLESAAERMNGVESPLLFPEPERNDHQR